MEKSNKARILNIVFSVLLFGGVWGIFEASVGTLLHMSFVTRSIFLASTTVLVPIAYMLMGACYKRTGTFRSVLYMGFLAAGIKAISCAIFAMDFNPVYYMLLESLAMGVALLVVRPKNVISFAGLGTFIFASTLYLLSSTFIRINVLEASGEDILNNITKYAFTYNCVAILYTFVAGAAIYGIMKLVEHYEWDMSKVKKVIFHPAFASSMVIIAVAVTLILH